VETTSQLDLLLYPNINNSLKFRFVFWDVRAASIIALMMEAALSSETSVDN
jgi:hypothetical protein